MTNFKKEYKNEKITIVWDKDKCIHSGNCVRGLPEVFQPKERPWIKIEMAPTEAIKDQVLKCPTKALSYYENVISDENSKL